MEMQSNNIEYLLQEKESVARKIAEFERRDLTSYEQAVLEDMRKVLNDINRIIREKAE